MNYEIKEIKRSYQLFKSHFAKFRRQVLHNGVSITLIPYPVQTSEKNLYKLDCGNRCTSSFLTIYLNTSIFKIEILQRSYATFKKEKSM